MSGIHSSRRGTPSHERSSYTETAVDRRRGRNAQPRVDASSLATVRELLKEIRRLEDEVDALTEDNEDLIQRMEELLEENDSLRRELGLKHAPGSAFPDGRFKSTPRSNNYRRTWEELEERESTKATVRDRSTGQRSTKSSGSTGRAVRYQDDDLSDDQKDRKRSESNMSNARKSSGSHTVAFERTNEVISVPVMGVMRPSRSRVSTPFFSEEAVSKMMNPKQPANPQSSNDDSSGSSSSEETQSQVNFEPDVHVVEVPFGGDSDETGSHHSRSVRGRIATPFIHDVPTKDVTEPKSDETTS